MLLKTVAASFCLLLVIGIPSLHAQKFSAVFNISNFRINDANSGNTTIDYQGSTSVLLNARFFNENRWALRVGVGLDNLNYSVSDSVTTNYEARRRDLKGVLGIEKHFKASFLDFYPGLYIPITVVGEDILGQNYDNIRNGGVRAGLGFVAGVNARLLEFLLIGVELDATFDDFKAGFRDGVNQLSFAPVSEVNFKPSFVIGITF